MKKSKKESFKSAEAFRKAKGFLLTPDKSFGKGEKGTRLKDAATYVLVLQLVFAAGSMLFILFARSFMPVDILTTDFVFLYIQGMILVLVAGLWTHLWAYVFGARKGLWQTLKAVFYAGTPIYLFSWIPESIFREYNLLLSYPGMAGSIAEKVLLAIWPISVPAVLLLYLWAALLLVKGLKISHNMTATRASGAILVSIITAIYLIGAIISLGLP